MENENNKTSLIVLQKSPSKQLGSINITGKFNVEYEADGLTVVGAEVLKHIVLVVTRTANYQSITPFKKVVVFGDDVIETEKGCSGAFSFNLFDKIDFNGPGDYYILCSLGAITSNIIHVQFKE